MSEAERTTIAEAGLEPDRFAPGDTRALVVVLRFGRTLGDDDVSGVVAFGSTGDGVQLAYPLALLLLQRREFDGAATLLIAGAARQPRANREYATWKWWEYTYGHRDDYQQLTRDVTMALLHRHDAGTAAEREVVADLFGKPALSADDVREMRRRLAAPDPAR